jgi:thiol-disulfide isomerase/thioredoxin
MQTEDDPARPAKTTPSGAPPPPPPSSPGKPARLTKERALILLGIVLLSTYLVFRQNAAMRQVGVGQTTDWRWVVGDPEGGRVDLSELRGKPVFLNIWATWCPPCVTELPSIARLARDPKVRAAGIQVLCVSVDGEATDVVDFLAARRGQLEGPRYVVASDAPAPFLTDGIPATFLVAPDGRIVESKVGMDDWSRPEVIDRVVALAEQASATPAVKADGEP